MNAWLLSLAMLCSVSSVPDGSLLFLENSNQFVERYTGSATTHVAVVLNDDEQAWVYEATPGEVRKLSLPDYFEELGRLNARRSAQRKIRLWIAAPRDPYSPQQRQAMRACLEQNLGRRYSIKGHVRGQSDGIHCAELAAITLRAATRLDIERCQDESPGSLLEKVKPHSRPLALLRIEEPREQEEWPTRCSGDWLRFQNWCQWSCWETWTWCW